MLRRIVAVATCAVVLAGCNGPTEAGTEPVTESSAQRSIQARWWTWAAAEPTATNPVADRTGEHCARNQPGDVWFLAGTFGGQVQRRCTVPLGVRLIAPAINLVGGDEADCRGYMAGATGTIQLDGAEVALERIEHEPITFMATPGNPVTDAHGKTRGDACGLWARIDPPSAGEHNVRIHGKSGTFEVYAEYILTVTDDHAKGALQPIRIGHAARRFSPATSTSVRCEYLGHRSGDRRFAGGRTQNSGAVRPGDIWPVKAGTGT